MPAVWLTDRGLWVQAGIAIAGTVSYFLLFRSWRDWWHVVYDIPACLFVFSFIGQLLAIVLAIRWMVFDKGEHWQTYNAILFAVVASLLPIIVGQMLADRP